jgi:subtilase family serine protease
MKSRQVVAGLVIGATALCCATALAATSRPDLAITSLVDPPSPVRAGVQFSTAVGVANRGKARARASRTSFFLSRDGRSRDLVLGTLPAPRLRPGSTSVKGVRFDVPGSARPGEYNLVACADSGHAVRERSEGNNCFGSAWTMTITP